MTFIIKIQKIQMGELIKTNLLFLTSAKVKKELFAHYFILIGKKIHLKNLIIAKLKFK